MELIITLCNHGEQKKHFSMHKTYETDMAECSFKRKKKLAYTDQYSKNLILVPYPSPEVLHHFCMIGPS